MTIGFAALVCVPAPMPAYVYAAAHAWRLS